MAYLHCLYQEMRHSNRFQNVLLICVSLERLSYLLKCYLYLEGTDEVCLLFQKYLLGTICHQTTGLKYETLHPHRRKMGNSSLSLTSLFRTFPKDNL